MNSKGLRGDLEQVKFKYAAATRHRFAPLIGTLGNYDGDGKENFKKEIG